MFNKNMENLLKMHFFNTMLETLYSYYSQEYKIPQLIKISKWN